MKLLVPDPPCLLETIEGLLQSADIVWSATALWDVSGVEGEMGQVQRWEQAQEENLGRRMKS